MLRRLRLLLLLVCIVSVTNAKKHTAELVKKETTLFSAPISIVSKSITDTAAHLIFEDAKTKIFYTESICDNAAVLKLKIINLTDASSMVTYKLWPDATPKLVSLFAKQELEGNCSLEYKSVLLETIPAGLTISDIKVSVTY